MPSTTALWHGSDSPLAQSAAYEVSLATTLEEVCACQRLRYQVFNGNWGKDWNRRMHGGSIATTLT